MFEQIKSYYPKVIFIETAMILLLCWLLWGTHKADSQSKAVISQDSEITKVTITDHATLKGLDKKEAREKKIITEDVAKDPDKAVLASGKIEDDSGSRNLFVVLDKKTGESNIQEKRKFIESMNRFEIGIGYGFESGYEAKAFQARWTIGRTSNFYLTGQGQLFDVDRMERQHPWNALAFINLRF